jgi:5-methylcytosine-specific restriction endonuclease McrA
MTARPLEERQARDLLRKAAKEAAGAREPKADRKAVLQWREPVEVPDRPRPTAAERRLVLTRQGGCCGHLGCTETQGLEIDHQIPRDLGGKDHVDNYVALCVPHHKTKTQRDRKMIDRARRLRKAAAEPLPKGTIKSRGFDKGYRPMASTRRG